MLAASFLHKRRKGDNLAGGGWGKGPGGWQLVLWKEARSLSLRDFGLVNCCLYWSFVAEFEGFSFVTEQIARFVQAIDEISSGGCGIVAHHASMVFAKRWLTADESDTQDVVGDGECSGFVQTMPFSPGWGPIQIGKLLLEAALTMNDTTLNQLRILSKEAYDTIAIFSFRYHQTPPVET